MKIKICKNCGLLEKQHSRFGPKCKKFKPQETAVPGGGVKNKDTLKEFEEVGEANFGTKGLK